MTGVQPGKNSVGSLFTSTVSVLLLRTMGMSGIRHRFAVLSNQPCKIALFDTFNVVFCALYILTSSLSNTVIYHAPANFAVLRRKWVSMEGTMCTSFAGCQTLCTSLVTVAAAVLVPSGNWKILLDMRPVGMRGAVRVPTLDVAAQSAAMEGMEPLRTPFLMICSRVVTLLTLLMVSCTLTWQDGGAVSYRIE